MGIFSRWRYRPNRDVSFGCEYCADDHNRQYGHVQQIGYSDETGRILLRCPRCSALYDASHVEDEVERLDVATAAERFPNADLTAEG